MLSVALLPEGHGVCTDLATARPLTQPLHTCLGLSLSSSALSLAVGNVAS